MDEDRLLILRALEEDAVRDDLTSRATVPDESVGGAVITSKAAGVVSGTEIVDRLFRIVDDRITSRWLKRNSDEVLEGDVICRIHGPLRSILAAERTALNFLQHLSGIASATRAFVDAVAGTGCLVADTRKTTPGLRRLEKRAVRHGGGVNHRSDLASGMLIKENHIKAAGSITEAVKACRRMNAGVWIEVECETLEEVAEAVEACPDMILLDNMDVENVRCARRIVPTGILLEASGDITPENARSYAETGIDRIAVGAITHSSKALNLSMRLSPR